jgi:3-phenylpropionate/cinnamic acid dioxygenase small subunit
VAGMSIEDRLEVTDLLARYAECVDTADIEGYADLFLPEGIVEHSGGSVRGRDAIRVWVAGLEKEGRIGPKSNLKHFLGLPVIRGDGQRCTARTYVLNPRQMETGEISTRLAGTYRDEIVKQDGRWQIEKRLIDLDFAARP